MTTKLRRCKDCLVERAEADRQTLERPAPHPGPRCTTHHRIFVKAAKARAAQRRDAATYGLLPGGYEELYRLQGGRCAICQRATGKTRRLSVDHDHATGEVRGILCRPCNTMLGHLRDNVDTASRVVGYLSWPPALDLDPKYIERTT